MGLNFPRGKSLWLRPISLSTQPLRFGRGRPGSNLGLAGGMSGTNEHLTGNEPETRGPMSLSRQPLALGWDQAMLGALAG